MVHTETSYWRLPAGVDPGGSPLQLTTDDLEEGSDYVTFVDRPDVGDADGEDTDEEDFYGPAADEPNWGGLSPGNSSLDESFHTARDSLSSGGDPFESSRLSGLGSSPAVGPAISPIRRGDFFDFDLGCQDIPTQRRILYSSEGDVTPPPEPTTTCLGK